MLGQAPQAAGSGKRARSRYNQRHQNVKGEKRTADIGGENGRREQNKCAGHSHRAGSTAS
jgi:hypothetical protein